MLTCFKKKPSLVLGIDIGLTAINVLEISNTQGQYCVEGYGSIRLPNNTNDPDAIAARIKKIISSASLSTRKAVLAVSDSNVISKVIQISAHIPEEDIEDWVLLDVEKYIPYSLNEMYLDFKILGPAPQDASQLNVLVVISRAETVERRVEMIRRSGLQVQIVDVESYAIERAARLWSAEFASSQHEEYTALFDINLSYLRCFLFKGHHIIFSREEVLSETDDWASFRKLVLQQMNRNVKFCISNFQLEGIDRIALAGNPLKVKELAPLIQPHLGIPTYIANPFKNLKCATAEIRKKIDEKASELIVVCGLALRR